MTTYGITAFITGVSSLSGLAAIQETSAPVASGSPGFTPTTPASVINGGSRVVRLQSTLPFSIVYVTVGGINGVVNGHWMLTLPSATTDTYIVITMARNMPVSSFMTLISTATGTSQRTTPVEVTTTVITAATGDVQVSVSWDTASDVDLHVTEPSGERIYWSHKTSATGGALDLDSNAACTIDNKNNENIRWTSAPTGTYTVAVDYYNSCGAGTTQYVVTINNGGTQALYTGSFSGTGDRGASPRTIATFTRGTGVSRFVDATHGLLPALPPTGLKPGR